MQAGVNVVDCEVTIEDSTLMDQSTFESDANNMTLYEVTQGSLKEHISNQVPILFMLKPAYKH